MIAAGGDGRLTVAPHKSLERNSASARPMNRLSFVSDSTFDAERLRRQLAGLIDVDFVELAGIHQARPGRFTVVSAKFSDASHLLDLKEWVKAKPKGGKVIFATQPGSRLEQTQAYALGATDVVNSPIDTKELLQKIWSDFAVLGGDASDLRAQGHAGAAAAHDGLQSIFSVCRGDTLDTSKVTTASSAVVDEIESKGLSSWVDIVRKHHSQTYQHCLLVTGVAAAFGQHLGLGMADRNRLSFAGMLHDVGKAMVPVAILEKPGSLDADEMAVMKKHPEYGIEALKSGVDLQPEMIDIVLHHHEYLDGSGYPHGLQAHEIADLVRITTIVDVYSALIEHRAYRPPMPSQKAYDILREMGPKLDQDLVRAFGFVAKLT
jgi:putative nucleotidyltransferase with HDIG domain